MSCKLGNIVIAQSQVYIDSFVFCPCKGYYIIGMTCYIINFPEKLCVKHLEIKSF